MYMAMYDIATEQGVPLGDKALYRARRALGGACERAQRYRTSDEMKGILSEAWRPGSSTRARIADAMKERGLRSAGGSEWFTLGASEPVLV
jgi:hypothetical protein